MAGHSGNQGSDGSGGVGAVGGGVFVPLLPDRVDLPFVTESVYQGSQIYIAKKTTGVTIFPEKRWSAEWLAWVALSEYVQTDYRNKPPVAWKDPTLAGPDQDPLSEIEKLVIAARDERADALAEIVAQHDSFADYFFALLTIEPGMYPATSLLINISSIVAAVTVLYYKYGVPHIYDPRPRPSQVCPALLPPVPVPGHPSYPSGHATEAHLIELVLNDVFSAAGNSNRADAMQYDLSALADRIARNREIAGLHYPSDSAAGKKLAQDIHTLLQDPKCKIYLNAMQAAQTEWSK
jgi:hypothetical protein